MYLKRALNQFSIVSFNHILVGSSLSISCPFPVEGIYICSVYCTHKSFLYIRTSLFLLISISCIATVCSVLTTLAIISVYTVPINAQVEHPDFMPFENREFHERSAPTSPASQSWIKECAEQDLRGLLCDTFRNQQEWMFRAKQVLYDPETMPEVSVAYVAACVSASLPPFFFLSYTTIYCIYLLSFAQHLCCTTS